MIQQRRNTHSHSMLVSATVLLAVMAVVSDWSTTPSTGRIPTIASVQAFQRPLARIPGRSRTSPSSPVDSLPSSPSPSASTSTHSTTTGLHMCGLVAAVQDVWSEDNRKDSNTDDSDELWQSHVLQDATSILYHRGPDGQQTATDGSFANTNANGDSNDKSDNRDSSSSTKWGMGHTRLAIVDPANRQADMPFRLDFRSSDQDDHGDGDDDSISNNNNNNNSILHLAANGEIYNHEALYATMTSKDNNSDNKQPWTHTRMSGSDCEIIAHAYSYYGGPTAVTKLDGMFAFVVFEEDPTTGQITQAFAARDPVGIKPLYYGRSTSNTSYVFASELKALVGHVDPASVVAVPPGHYWTPATGLVRYYAPDWLMQEEYAPWKLSSSQDAVVSDEAIREAFAKAVEKRMMADVEYGFFLSGGIDSCVVAHDLLPLYRAQREARGDFRPINTYTVGMENSPDVMAARAMVDALGGPKYVNHHVRLFTPEEVFELIPKIVYHMETYEAELIRSSIPNWLLAERAAEDVKMVLTGEGADELFAGYLYFQDAESPQQVQDELRRIYNMLGNINLHRTDRMTMAHGLEARVPFLDTEFTKLVMSVDPALKMVDPEAVQTNSRGREKTLLREIFEGPNANGDTIPRPVLWRAKAMQCEGVGEDWVSLLQQKIASLVTDQEMAEAVVDYPNNTPQTKEELYYRRIFDEHFHGMEHVVKLWEGGGRAMGAAWKSDLYTREGLKDVNMLRHSLQTEQDSTKNNGKSLAAVASEEACSAAKEAGYDDFEALLTSGGDDRSLITNLDTKTNKYHIRPQPINDEHIFRGSCTGNPPTRRGYEAARRLYERMKEAEQVDEQHEEQVTEDVEETNKTIMKTTKMDSVMADVFRDQRDRMAKLLDLPEGAEIILCPSGSDAEYLPLAIAKTINPNAKITNGVTQLKEIGAGSAPAAMGRYFSTISPLGGDLSSQPEHLTGLEAIEGEIIAARNKDGGVVDSCGKMDDFANAALAEGLYPISHAVFGGKTGLRDLVVPRSLDAGRTSLGVVDACQGRFTSEELREWLDEDSLVLFTGSKFFQAPPFCGAVIVPPAVAEQVRLASTDGMQKAIFGLNGLGGFITDKEVPESFEKWTSLLKQKDANNVGLALRWEAGLAGMEALAGVSDEERTTHVSTWADAVTKMVNASPRLDAWCVERSIISIRVARENGWMETSDLRDLYRWMSMDISHLVPHASRTEKKALATPAYIGQPVDVSGEHGIVRIALGVESMLTYIDNPVATLNEDLMTVQKLGAISKYFDILHESEQPINPISSWNSTETSKELINAP